MGPEQTAAEEAPFYVRWGPEHSQFAIELKLDLVSKISNELLPAEQKDIEIGGLLIGGVVTAPTPTFRIEDVEILPRPENGAIFMLGPDYQERFEEVRRGGKGRRKAAVGLFRSHCRPGPLKPSLADRTILSAEFGQAPYVLLLIQSRPPRAAAFFIAQNGELPADTSVREFRFNEAEFKALPEVEADPAATLPELSDGRPVLGRRWYVWTGLATLVLAVVVWFGVVKAGLPGWLAAGSKQLDLRITGQDHLMRISWNHDARQIGLSSNATLEIVDGQNRVSLKLGADELKLGNVEYDRASSGVEVTMTVNNSNSAPVTQYARWGPK